ncbi:MAG: hypothetical protein H7Y00_05025, partial [Fimbriimonadaceae bacterium]|nr:hypothetical protein [Chitinophagales bacterium]
MNRIKTRQKQLVHYSLLAGSLLAITNVAEAQIIYTDIDPDEILNSGTFLDEEEYSLDVNADGISDFNFRIAYHTSYEAGPKAWFASVEPFSSNGIGYTISNFTSVSCYGAITTAPVILEMGEGDTISEDLNFLNDNAVVFWINEVTDPVCYTTQIFGVETYGPAFYIPIRLSIDSSYHYGWVRYRVISATKTKIIDYAYEASIGVPIIAGKDFSLSVTLDAALNVDAADIDNFGDGRDVQIVFDKAANE